MRKIAALLFMTVGLLCVFTLANSALQGVMPIGAPLFGGLFMTSLSFVTALYLFKPLTFWDGMLRCRTCSSVGLIRQAEVISRRPGLIIYVIGLLDVFMLIRSLRSRPFLCSACSDRSYRRPISALLILLWCLALVGLAVIGSSEPS